MRRKKRLRVAVFAALIISAAILGVAAFSSSPDNEKMTGISPQLTAIPESETPQTDVSISPPEKTKEVEETPMPTKTPAATTNSGAAFTLKIKDRTISVAYGV